jgi:PiT family inorganic phosphate transporter
MDVSIPYFTAGLCLSFYMAWNIGANDLANSMGDVVGSKSLSLGPVILLAGLMTFLGAVIYGSKVAQTVGGGIVPITSIDPHLVLVGCLSALFSAALWVTIATYFSLPVSTSHSIVSAMLGFGLGCVRINVIEFGDIYWTVLLKIVISWVVSPFAGMIFAYVVFKAVTFAIRRSGDIAFMESKVFRYLVIASSAYQAFSFGSNDVSNAIAPVVASFGMLDSEIPIWFLAFGGFGIAVGLATWGYRVVWTLGKKITELTPSRGFSADIGCATTVFICSTLGMPVSTTHAIVGAIIGVGLARGLDAVNFGEVKQIVSSWIITVPAAVTISFGVFSMLHLIGV